MASRLSTHMTKSLEGLLSRLAAVTQPRESSADLVDLSSAENLLVRDQVREICINAVQDHLTTDALSQLPSFGGDVDTRTALASFFSGYFRPASTVSFDQIVLTAGAGSCVEALVYSFCDEGDSVLIPGPYWFGFEPYINLRPKVNIVTANPQSYAHHATDLLATLRATYAATENPQRIKAVILCNPHNPFSQCYPENILRSCMSFCQEFNLHFISDELYALAEINPTKEQRSKFVSALSLASDPNDHDGLIDPSLVHVVWSASKLFGLSGFRIGCLVSQANPRVRAAVSLLTYSNTSSLSAIALKALLSSLDLSSLINVSSQRLTDSYSRFVELFEERGIDYLPANSGLFVFAKLGKKATNAEEEAIFFEKLKFGGVMVSPGRFYIGLSTEFGWARITVAVPLEIVEVALERLKRCLE
ncbi:PLP-dependent transferase [Lophium mytilinum]|uniref:PLP-dependent transferase n=1 Tax=Lophium mytilinum TaxID=390894 RepID=A0A6A6QKT0_9PEZI|nr:PLP-dependent transferase [Lophium mytilinum]